MANIVIGAKIQADTGQASQKVKDWKAELRTARDELENIRKANGKNSEEYENQAEKIKELNKQIKLGGVESVKSWKAELKDAKQELKAASDKYGELSTEALNAARKVAVLTDKMGDQKKLVDGLNPDAKFKALGNAMQGAVGGITAATGAMGLFGETSDDTQKLLLKVQSAMALTQGLNALGEAKDSFMQLGAILGIVTPKVQANATATAEQTAASEAAAAAATAQAEATVAQATATEGAAVATKGLGGAMKAIGIGIIIGLVIALAENWDRLKVSLGFATKEQEAYKDAVKDAMQAAVQDTAKAVESVTSVRNAFDMARKGVISKREALEKYNETLGDSMGRTDSLATAEKRLGDKADAYIQMTMLKAQANVLFQKAAEEAAKALNLQNEDQTSWFDKAKSGIQSFVGDYSGSVQTMVNAQDAAVEKGQKSSKKLQDMLETQGKDLLTKMNNLGKDNGVKTEDQQVLTKKMQEEAAKSFAVREQIIKSQQERTLLLMKEGEAKQLKAQAFAYQDEKRQIKEQQRERQLTAGQAGALLAEAEKSNADKVEKIRKDAGKERMEKERAFIQQLSDLQEFENLNAIKNEAVKEKYALEKAADQKRMQVLQDEKLTADQRRALLDAIDRDLEAHKKDVDKKHDADDKKRQRDLNKRIADFQATIAQNEADYYDKRRSAADVELANAKAQYDQDIQLAGDNALRKAEIEQQYTEAKRQNKDARKLIDQDEHENGLKLATASGQIASAVSGLIGQQTAVGKGLAAASAAIDTYAAISGTLKAYSGVPIPGFAIAQAIATGIAGFNNVRKLLAVQVPTTTGASASVSAPSLTMPTTVSSPVTPQAQSTRLDQSSINAIGDASSGRAFVLETDVSNNQERTRRLNRAARL